MTIASWIAAHLAACAALALLLGVPGSALVRLLGRLDLRLPRMLLPATAFVLGLAQLTLLLAVVLTVGGSMAHVLVAHAVASGVLAIAAVAGWARGRTSTDAAAADAAEAIARAPVERWTLVAVGMCVLLAELVRTRLAFDTLFHLGLVRRLATLPELHWDTLDRTVGAGVNPSYVVPAWQAAMAAVARVTGLDAATVVEGMAMLLVGVAACTAAGLGRVVSGRGAGEVAGVAAFALLRIWYPRRELEGDGISYAALPGNVALDIVLPLLLALAVLLAVRVDRRGRRGLGPLAAVAVTLFVLLHANYAVYLAIVGAGILAWVLVVGPSGRDARRGLLRATAWIAIPGAATLGALLPVLVLLENFARSHEARSSIEYFLRGEGAWQTVRPAHLYELSAMPGLLAIAVLLPLAAWHGRGIARALVGGGALGIFAFAFVPPLLAALAATGSLTIGLRMPRLMTALLVAAAAIALPVLAAALRERYRAAGSGWRRAAWLALPFLGVAVLSVLYGYPRARRDPAEYGWDWPALTAVAALLAVMVLEVRRARAATRPAGPTDSATPARVGAEHPGRDPLASTVAVLAIALAVAMLPSGIQSLRRAGWQAVQWEPARRADDLGCYAGVQGALAAVEPGAVVLADPVTSYGIPALAPGYVVADFKTWNGATDDSPAQQRIERMVVAWSDDEDAVPEFVGLLRDQRVDYVVAGTGEAEPPLGSEDDHVYRSDAVRAFIKDHPHMFRLLDEGPGVNVAGPGAARCRLHAWKVDRDQLVEAPYNATSGGVTGWDITTRWESP